MLPDKVREFLEELKKDCGILPSDLHITRKACALVAISNGKVIKTQRPLVNHCPLFTRLFNHAAIDEKSIEDKFARHTVEWGMFNSNRRICDEKIIVPFGASEMLMYALKRGEIDAAVTACDGAGTVVTTNPAVVQGIGAYMNGIFYTSPIREVINRIKENGGYILSPDDAEIDQLKGVKRAAGMGFKNIAVTVRGDEKTVIKKLREYQTELRSNSKEPAEKTSGEIRPGPKRIVVLAICNTGIDEQAAVTIRANADLAWACASKHIREIVGPESILQVGMKIPVFVLTGSGLDFVSSYSSDKILKQKLRFLDKKHYVTSSRYEENSIKINMGKFSVFLYETPSLPVSAADEPDPLI